MEVNSLENQKYLANHDQELEPNYNKVSIFYHLTLKETNQQFEITTNSNFLIEK